VSYSQEIIAGTKMTDDQHDAIHSLLPAYRPVMHLDKLVHPILKRGTIHPASDTELMMVFREIDVWVQEAKVQMTRIEKMLQCENGNKRRAYENKGGNND